MIKSIDGHSIAAIVRMQRQIHRRKTFLIVEGSNDLNVVADMVEEAVCEIVNGFKKQNVIDAILILEDDGYVGVCGIIDADYDRLLNIPNESENIIVTEFHDMDIILVMSPAFSKYIKIVGDAKMVSSFEQLKGEDCRSSVMKAASIVGAARLAVLEKGLIIYFSDCELHEFIDKASLSVSDDIFDYLIERSVNPKCNAGQLKKLTQAVLERDHPPSDLCQGHDVAKVLGIALQGALASRHIAQTWGSEVERGLRLAFDRECFLATKLHAELRAWEQRNPPWRILFAA